MSGTPARDALVPGDFAAMMDASPMCVLVHDADSKRILWANRAACAMLEFSLDEIRPLTATDMSSASRQYDRAIGRAWLHQAAVSGTSRMEWHYRSKSDRVIRTDAVAVRVELSRGAAVMVQFRDIEREHRVEQELKLTTSLVEALSRHSSAAAYLVDVGGCVIHATGSALSLISVTADLLPIRLLSRGTFLMDGRDVSWTDLTRSLEGAATVQFVTADGDETRWLEGSLETVDTERDRHFLLILHDVSGRVAEERRRGRELEHENYLARYTAMGDLAMAVAHELSQPLAAARNFLAYLDQSPKAISASHPGGVPDSRSRQAVVGASRQIDRAVSIVEALRAFVGRLEQINQVADLNHIVTECLYFVRQRAQQENVRIVTQMSGDPVPVVCERVLTGQVVLNLCYNAIEAMTEVPSPGRVLTITTGRGTDPAMPGHGLCLVDDQGIGIARDPFTTPFSSKERGLGVGLALSYRIISRQGGSIWGMPNPDGGSRFGFTLPLAGGGSPGASQH